MSSHRSTAIILKRLRKGQRMNDTSHSLIIWIFMGAISGGIASFVWRGKPYGILKDIIIGILGACIASFLAHALQISVPNSHFLDVVVSTAGALIVLVVVRLYRSN